MVLMLISLLAVIWNHRQVQSHVSLTYPAARNYRLDFLTQANSIISCGMPKGDIKTSFLSGSRFNVTWSLAYPHKGGFRLQLLDSLERPLLDLTPIVSGKQFINDQDITAQTYEIQLPSNYTCYNCTIRLIREALEWSPDYKFWSCADIDILPRKEFRENCNNHGRYLIGRCICDRLYFGDKCQYRDECIIDSDCGLFGKCEELNTSTIAPKKFCYCQTGWFGSGCGRKSAIKKADIDFERYKNRKLSENFNLYWRILEDKHEIEMIIVANGTSYVAIGWRPKSLKECPMNYNQLKKVTKREDSSDDKLKSNISFKLTSKDDGDNIVKNQTENLNKEFHPMDCTDIIIGTVRNKSYRISDYFTRDQSTPQFDSFFGGKNDLVTAIGYENELNQMVLLFRKKMISEEFTDHSIGNETMHVIWAKGQESGQYNHKPDIGLELEKAKKFYAIDELKYHGFGEMQRGWTDINFFEDNKNESFVTTTVTENMTKHDPRNSLEGRTIACGDQYRYPPRCDESKNTCEYVAKWEYIYKSDAIRFTIRSKHVDKWTGIGFSNDEKMSQTDAIVGWIDSKTNQPFLMDTWILGYMRPVLDQSQDITNITGKKESDYVIMSFVRKRISKDKKDLSFTDDQCLYMMYPVKGGTYNSVNKKIGKHEETPKVSLERICIKPCQDFNDYENELDNIEKLLKKYPISIKVIELGEHFQIPKIGSIEFQDLSNSISDNFRMVFEKKLDGFQEVAVTDLSLDTNTDSVVVRMDLILTNESRIDEDKLRNILWDVVRSGRANVLKLDKDYLIYEIPKSYSKIETSLVKESGISFTLKDYELYILVGSISALVILMIIQASCTIYQNKNKRRQTYKQHLQVPPWRTVNSSHSNHNSYEYEYDRKYRNSNGTINSPKQKTIQRNNYYGESKTLQRPTYVSQQNGGSGVYDRGALSLPRTAINRQTVVSNGPRAEFINDGRSKSFQPDFYFMPSQRKYSGEVVRVYVEPNGVQRRH